MNTIKFRGKNIHTGEWLYGDYHREGKIHYIAKPEQYLCEYAPIEFIVDANTISQFTGLYDKNGKEIYEGDIIRLDFHAWLDWKELDSVKAEIVYDNGTFEARWKNPDAGKPYPFQNPDDEEDVEAEYVCEFIGNLPKTIEVIGNRFDNPELLK